nr:TolC family protein [Bacteroidales bacterium]
KNSSASQNTGLNIYKHNIELSRYNSKDIVSQRYPKLSFLMNYNFTRSENQAGFSLLNSNLGFTRGFTLSYSLFDGFNNNIKLKNAKLGEQQALMLFNQVKTEVESALLKAFNTFTLNLQMLNLEEENIKISRENLNVALEKFRLGTISSLEFKEAQNSFESAYIRLINARYDTKLSEITLMKLNGDLAK